MKSTLHLAVSSGKSAACIGIIGRTDFGDVAILILYNARAFDDVSTFETHFLVGRETEELLGRILHEVVALNPKFTTERHLVSTLGGILRVVVHDHGLGLSLGIVLQNKLDRILDYAHTSGGLVEVLAHRMLKKLDVVESLVTGVTDAVHEVLD